MFASSRTDPNCHFQSILKLQLILSFVLPYSANMEGSCVFSDEDEFDIVAYPGSKSLESSIDLDHVPKQEVHEPAPAKDALQKFNTVAYTPSDIQAYVRKTLDSASGRSAAYPMEQRTMRIYIDGVFDAFNPA